MFDHRPKWQVEFLNRSNRPTRPSSAGFQRVDTVRSGLDYREDFFAKASFGYPEFEGNPRICSSFLVVPLAAFQCLMPSDSSRASSTSPGLRYTILAKASAGSCSVLALEIHPLRQQSLIWQLKCSCKLISLLLRNAFELIRLAVGVCDFRPFISTVRYMYFTAVCLRKENAPVLCRTFERTQDGYRPGRCVYCSFGKSSSVSPGRSPVNFPRICRREAGRGMGEAFRAD